MPKCLPIVAGWFVAGVLFCLGSLFLLRPLAGLAAFILLFSLIIIVVAPIVHCRLQRSAGGEFEVYRAVMIVFAIVIALFFLGLFLAFSGWFNYT